MHECHKSCAQHWAHSVLIIVREQICTWTRLMRHWFPTSAKLCYEWKLHNGTKTFLLMTLEGLPLLLLLAKGQIHPSTIFWMFLLSCLSSHQYKRLGGKSKWLHHLTSAVGGPSAVEAAAQSVQWRRSVTASVHGLTTRSIKLSTNTQTFCLNSLSAFLVVFCTRHGDNWAVGEQSWS